MGFVYFIFCEDQPGLVKIGKANDVEQRLKCLQTARSSALRVLYRIASTMPYTLEHRIHAFLRNRWVRGEWFSLSVQEAKEVYLTYAAIHDRPGTADYHDVPPPLIAEGCGLTGPRWIDDFYFRRDRLSFESWARMERERFPTPELKEQRLSALLQEYDRRQTMQELKVTFDNWERYRFETKKVSKYFEATNRYQPFIKKSNNCLCPNVSFHTRIT